MARTPVESMCGKCLDSCENLSLKCADSCRKRRSAGQTIETTLGTIETTLGTILRQRWGQYWYSVCWTVYTSDDRKLSKVCAESSSRLSSKGRNCGTCWLSVGTSGLTLREIGLKGLVGC